MKEDVKFAIRKPCTDCYITGATPRLTYADGTTANTDTGLWLHHFVLFSSGGVDARCGNTLAALVGEVFFTGANERTAAHSPAGTGYRVHPLDSWSLMVDLMNMNAVPKDVKFEVTYDWVPASTPGMHAMKPVFMDVGEACVNSTVPAGTGQYSRKNTWTATVPGRVMGIASHMHDGGTRVVLRNLTTGATICDSKAYYGGPGFESPGGHTDHDDTPRWSRPPISRRWTSASPGARTSRWPSSPRRPTRDRGVLRRRPPPPRSQRSGHGAGLHVRPTGGDGLTGGAGG